MGAFDGRGFDILMQRVDALSLYSVMRLVQIPRRSCINNCIHTHSLSLSLERDHVTKDLQGLGQKCASGRSLRRAAAELRNIQPIVAHVALASSSCEKRPQFFSRNLNTKVASIRLPGPN